jgi:hypothetical protein
VGHIKASQVAELLIQLIIFFELEIIQDDMGVGISMTHPYFSCKNEVYLWVIKVEVGIV